MDIGTPRIPEGGNIRNTAISAIVLVCGAVASADAGEITPDWATPKKYRDLAPHPRLFVSQEQIARMVEGRGEAFEEAYEKVAAAAETGVRDAETPMQGIGSLRRSHLIIGRLVSMAIQWHRTRDRRFIEAALKNVDGMRSWLRPTGQVNLMEGQDIAAVAMMYDLLHNDLSPDERAFMVEFAREHCIRPFLRVTGRGKRLSTDGERGSWWQGIVSNWNPVCVSGAGMLALAMYEDIPEAQTVVDRVQQSLDPIVKYLEKTGGGWVEGVGYWNWTMHYSFLFHMSLERTTGEKSAWLRSPAVRSTMLFGQHFVPHDEACGFGDNNHGDFSSSQYATAEHLGYEDVLARLQQYRRHYEEVRARKAEFRGEKKPEPAKDTEPDVEPKTVNIGYGTPLDLLIDPDPLPAEEAPQPRSGVAHSYPEQGWGMVADRWPEPNVYASVRGGVLGGPHTHADLLSWNAVVGIERMILNINRAGYYDTAWEGRAKDIYERNQTSKNTLFLAGVSAFTGNNPRRGGMARAKTARFDLPTGAALRLEAARAFYFVRRNPRFVGRLFTTIDDRAVLVLDCVEMPGRNPVEARIHTEKEAVFGETDVLLRGEFETAWMTFASDQPAVLRRSTALLTEGRQEPPTIMRWQTLGSVSKVTLASLLTRGEEEVELQVRSDDTHVTVTVAEGEWRRTIKLTRRLGPEEGAD